MSGLSHLDDAANIHCRLHLHLSLQVTQLYYRQILYVKLDFMCIFVHYLKYGLR